MRKYRDLASQRGHSGGVHHRGGGAGGVRQGVPEGPGEDCGSFEPYETFDEGDVVYIRFREGEGIIRRVFGDEENRVRVVSLSDNLDKDAFGGVDDINPSILEASVG